MLFKKKNVILFDSPPVNEVEFKIARSLNLTVYSENKKILGKLIEEEIQISKIPKETLLNHFLKNKQHLIRFGINMYRHEFLEDGEEYPNGEELSKTEESQTISSCGLGIGFGITYAIYYHFLSNDNTLGLKEYLKLRRIPYHTKFLSRLIGYYENSQNSNEP